MAALALLALGCGGRRQAPRDAASPRDGAPAETGGGAGAGGSDGAAGGSMAGGPGGSDGGRADGPDDTLADAPEAGAPAKLAHPSLAAVRAEIVGGWALGAAVADFNGDGRPDVAIGNVSTAYASILMNEGGGLFAPPSTYDVGGTGGGNWILASDLDGDRRPDLAVSIFNDPQDGAAGNRTVVLPNADNGSFGPPRKVADGEAIALADLDGDGKADLVVANGGNTNVLLNDGKGVTFHAAGTYTVGFGINRAAVGDLDKDGKPDLVVSTFADASTTAPELAGSLVVLLANGGGTFRQAKTYPLAKGASSIEIADVSGDGVPDLIANESLRVGSQAALNILVNEGDGSFADPAPLDVGPVEGVPTYFVARDLDRDGKVDLAVTGGGSPTRTLKVFRNLGGGLFDAARVHAVSVDIGSLEAGDVDGDGAVDLLMPTGTDGHLGVLRNRGDGTFPAGPALSAFRGTGLAAGDLDGDGKRDLVVAGTLGTVGIFRNDGHGVFPAPVVRTAASPRDVAVADFDGDGNLDLAFAGNGAGVFLNKRIASFANAVVYPTRPAPSGGGTPEVIAAADLNGDGAPDLVTLDGEDAGGGGVPATSPLSVLMNKRDGTFEAPVSYPAPVGRPRAGALAVADVNGDKAADLIVAGGGKAVGVLLNKGDGTFMPSVDIPATAPTCAVIADLNGDGAPDLAFVDLGFVAMRLNDGKGAFGSPMPPLPPPPASPSWSSVTAGDLDNDGKLDLLTAGAGVVGVAFGRGDATFEAPVFYLDVAPGPEPVVLATDLDGDGKVDVALLSAAGVSVILNDGK